MNLEEILSPAVSLATNETMAEVDGASLITSSATGISNTTGTEEGCVRRIADQATRTELEEGAIVDRILEKFRSRRNLPRGTTLPEEFVLADPDEVEFVDLLEVPRESRFYVRLERMCGTFEDFHESWNSHSRQNKQISHLFPAETEWKRGVICNVFYQNLWWRGILLRLVSVDSSQRAKVHLLDTGVRCFLDINDLLSVTEDEYFGSPPFAVECRNGSPHSKVSDLAQRHNRRCLMVVLEKLRGRGPKLSVSLTPAFQDTFPPTAPLLENAGDRVPFDEEYRRIVDHGKLKGAIYSVRISSFAHRGLFFLQPKAWDRASRRLQADIRAFYSRESVRDDGNFSPRLEKGEFCAWLQGGQSGEFWMRGLIREVEEDTVSVVGIDVGKTKQAITVPKAEVKKLEPQFHPDKYPPGAVACRFWDVNLSPGGDAKDEESVIEDLRTLEDPRAFFCKKWLAKDGDNVQQELWEVQLLGFSNGFPVQMSAIVANTQFGTTHSKLYGIPRLDFPMAAKGYPLPTAPLSEYLSPVSFLGFTEDEDCSFYIGLHSQRGWDYADIEGMLDFLLSGNGTRPLTEKMFPGSARGRQDTKLSPGLMCLAVIRKGDGSDPVCVRATVLEVLSPSNVKVLAIDLAEELDCSTSDLLWMGDSDLLCALPPFAIKCRFWNIERISHDTKEELVSYLNDSENDVMCSFASLSPDEDGCFSVVMTLNDENVNESLLKDRDAQPRRPYGKEVFPRFRTLTYERKRPSKFFHVLVARDYEKSSTIKEFLVDSEDVTDVFTGTDPPPGHPYKVSSGHAYAVEYGTAFLRAVIVSEEEEVGKTWLVDFVDSGEEGIVSEDSIYVLPSASLCRSRRHMSCSLAALDDMFPGRADECFRNLIAASNSGRFTLILQPNSKIEDPSNHAVVLYLRDRERKELFNVNCVLANSYGSEDMNLELGEFEKTKEEARPEDVEPSVYFKDVTLEGGDLEEQDCEVISAINPYKFFVLTPAHRLHSRDLKTEMDRYFRDPAVSDRVEKLTSFRGGSACIVSKTGTYYRARINAYFGSDCLVFYVDLGSFEKVDVSRMYKIPERFLKHPMLAIQCRAARIAPLIPDNPTERLPIESDWTPEALTRFRNSVLGTGVSLKLDGRRMQSRYPVHVTVGGMDLGDRLISEDPPVAVPLRSLKTRGFYSQTVPVDCVSEGWMDGQVLYAYNPAYFYWQFQCYDPVSSKVDSFLRNFSGVPMDPRRMGRGVACVAPYFDGNWCMYRAMMISKDPVKKTWKIVFVDYGNKEECKEEEIFDTTCDLMALHRTALKCCLEDSFSRVQDGEGSWLNSEVTRFQDLTVSSMQACKILVKEIRVEEPTNELLLIVRLKDENDSDILQLMNEPSMNLLPDSG